MDLRMNKMVSCVADCNLFGFYTWLSHDKVASGWVCYGEIDSFTLSQWSGHKTQHWQSGARTTSSWAPHVTRMEAKIEDCDKPYGTTDQWDMVNVRLVREQSVTFPTEDAGSSLGVVVFRSPNVRHLGERQREMEEDADGHGLKVMGSPAARRSLRLTWPRLILTFRAKKRDIHSCTPADFQAQAE